MTIKEKAKSTELPIEKVVEIASTIGIDVADTERKLESAEAMNLGKAVKKYMEVVVTEDDVPETVRFWSKATKHTIQAGNERIEIKGNILVLDAKEDIALIAIIRSLRNIVGRYSVYEVLDKAFEEDSDDAVWFSNMLEDIVFTGHNREHSKAGMKSIRAMFSAEQLEAMGKNGFDPRRLVMKALRSKSLKLVSNNG